MGRQDKRNREGRRREEKRREKTRPDNRSGVDRIWKRKKEDRRAYDIDRRKNGKVSKNRAEERR